MRSSFSLPFCAFGHLAHPLTARVINVIGLFAGAVVDDLPLRGAELILEIPLHHRQVRHGGHVAVGIVGVLRAVTGRGCVDRQLVRVHLASGWRAAGCCRAAY